MSFSTLPTAPSRPSRTFRSSRVYVPLVACLIVTSVVTYLLYTTTQNLFRWSVNERLLAVASVAALQFDPGDLDQIVGPDSISSDVYRSAVLRLQDIRRETRKVRYAYILRKTGNPLKMEFVADADSLDPAQPLDLNGDGVIDDADALVYPGDRYDVSAFPEFRESAFTAPFVDPELTEDQWGTFLAGTAPIRERNDDRPAHYVLGLDMDVSEFRAQTNRALWPFVGSVVFLLLSTTGLAMGLAGMWRGQVDQLAEIDRQKDELIGIVSHQLAAPATGIRWNLEEMLDGEFGELTDEQARHIQLVLDAANNLGTTTDLLLDVARIELGRLPMERRETDLGQLLHDTVAQVGEQAKRKSIDLHTDIPKRIPQAVVDPRLVRMAIDNVLSNAIKYTPEGGRVDVTARVTKCWLRCTIADTGIGIPKSDQSRIFGKLYRATNARAIQGHGFGLYVAKGSIEQQGGRLSFTSSEGAGTTFDIELPLA